MEQKLQPRITFDTSVSDLILDLFDKTTDDDGFVIEKNNLERVLTFDGRELPAKDFGGIQKGSEVFIDNNLVSLIKLSKGK